MLELWHWTEKRRKTSKSISLKHQKPFCYLPLIAKICKFLSVLFRFFLNHSRSFLKVGASNQKYYFKTMMRWNSCQLHFMYGIYNHYKPKVLFFFLNYAISAFLEKKLNKALCSINCLLNKKFTSHTWISISSIH